jgi:hypothetical protein
MNDLTGAKVLKGERILFNAFKDMYFTRLKKFEKLSTQLSVREFVLAVCTCACFLCNSDRFEVIRDFRS